MDTDALRGMLDQLHRELEHGQPLDDKTRQMLRTVLHDINEVLDEPPGEPTEEHQSLIDRLKEATWELEESHPKLTSRVGDLVEGLAAIFR